MRKIKYYVSSKKKLAEFRNFSNMKRGNHGQVEKARKELETLKEQKIRLMKTAAKKQKDFRDEMKKRQLEISRLRKVATKNQYKINQLTSQKKQSDKLLKARATQINHAQKKIRKLTMRKLGTNRGRNANNSNANNNNNNRKQRDTNSNKTKTF